MELSKKCAVCEVNRGVCAHHIIKRRKGGSDDEGNLVYLCPNHHWIADFGTDKEKEIVLNLIKEKTGKEGKEIAECEKEELDEKIKALEEDYLCGVPFPTLANGTYNKPFSEEEWKEHKKGWNYENNFKMLLGRGCTPIQCQLLHKKAEILILIRKLKKELGKIRF